jgi:photosystem II stability/assembly factor-like uncharacterized protein
MVRSGLVIPRAASPARRRSALTLAALLLFLLLLLAAAGQAPAFLGAGPQWYWMNPLPQGNTITGIDFGDDQHGWAVAGAGTILATADGGLTWQAQRSGVTQGLTSVCFVDADSGWAVGYSGTIVHTADGGEHWTTQSSGTTAPLASVSFADAQHGWAVGGSFDDGITLATTDGGQTWAPQMTPTVAQLFAVTSTDPSHAWIGGAGGSLLFTDDGGATWNPRYLDGSSSPSFRGLVFVDALHGWAVDLNGKIGVTTNGGDSWQDDTPVDSQYGQMAIAGGATRLWVVGQNGLILSRPVASDGSWAAQTSGTEGTLHTIASRSAGTALAGGGGGTLLATHDGGTTWTARSSGPVFQIQEIAFTDATHGWLVGKAETTSDALVYGSVDGGATWQRQLLDGAMNWLDGCAFADATHGWAAGWGGSIAATTDGSTWQTQVAPGWPNTSYYAMACTSAQHAWAVGSPPGTGASATVNMRATHDGGATWSPVTAGVTTTLSDITFPDTLHGWAVGDNGAIVASADGGYAWAPQASEVTSHLRGVDFVDASHGWAVGDDGTILTTANGGDQWTPQTSGIVQRITSVGFADLQHGWATTDSGEILSTTDGGHTWTTPGARSESVLYSVGVLDETHVWAAGEYGAVLGLDEVAPVSSVTSAPAPNAAGWNRSAVSIVISATDDRSGVASTEYRLTRDASWSLYTGPLSISTPGSTTCEYRSLDAAGNVEATASATVLIDTTRPVTKVLAAASVRRGRRATLRFRVKDAVSPKAKVTVKIYRRGASKPKKTLRLGLRATNRNLRYARYVCRLPRGAYVWRVYATDLAGNTQKTPAGSGRLTVR